MTTAGTARQVRVRLYLEGRYVGNGDAAYDISGEVGAPAMCSISVVPTNTIKHVLAGTWVHVFTTDPWDTAPAGDLSDFKLAFEGVVIGRGFSKRSDGRSMQINCADPSIYWTKARQYWLNITSAGGSIVDQLVLQTTGGYGHFGMLESNPVYGYMMSKVVGQDDTDEEHFLDTMLSVIDDIGVVNPFYNNARNRFRLTDRVIRGPAGKTEKLFQFAFFGDFLQGLAQQASGQTDLVEVINTLLSAAMHEWVSVPAAPYVQTRVFGRDQFGNIKRHKKTVVRPGDKKGTERKVDLFSFDVAQDSVVGNVIFKPQIYSLSPPSCNVLFPNMYDSLTFSENFLAEGTRMSMKPQMIGANFQNASIGLMLLRPTELEIFTGLVRNKQTGGRGDRAPDAKYANGTGQVPVYHDYDWTTNEERIRGIVFNFINLGPSPSSLTMTDPGKKTPSGAREGGMPKYLQNVASYEHYKAKFAARTTNLTGPYNMRPVCGFSLLALDDSPAAMNLVCHLQKKEDHISADGSATTTYLVTMPRLADEVDLNRVRFTGGIDEGGALDLSLATDAKGDFQFENLFEGQMRPPIPEWFDPSFATLQGLDQTYQKWFGPNARVLEQVLFNDPNDAARANVAAGAGILGAIAGTARVVAVDNETIDQLDAVKELVRRYAAARDRGREFVMASAFTDRSFTRIGDAFRFVGAAPLENEKVVANGIDYAKHTLKTFVGTVANGYGYAAVPEGEETVQAVRTATDTNGLVATLATDALAAVDPIMSAAFPIFETRVHIDPKAQTDQPTRDALLAKESGPSKFPRYDGRPTMFDFEFRLWQQSLVEAGFTPDGQKLAENAVSADYLVTDNGKARAATPEERAAATKKRQDQLAADAAAATKKKRTAPKTMTPAQQAPTGDAVNGSEKLPLPQPLSESQVVQLRRRIVDAYRSELEKNRGFSG